MGKEENSFFLPVVLSVGQIFTSKGDRLTRENQINSHANRSPTYVRESESPPAWDSENERETEGRKSSRARDEGRCLRSFQWSLQGDKKSTPVVNRSLPGPIDMSKELTFENLLKARPLIQILLVVFLSLKLKLPLTQSNLYGTKAHLGAAHAGLPRHKTSYSNWFSDLWLTSVSTFLQSVSILITLSW